jgi:hypothetical protein
VLLWRGTRDGFNLITFHYRCDGHTNTVTFILDSGGYIFWWFSLCLAWDSSTGYKNDSLNRSFVFTLKNSFGNRTIIRCLNLNMKCIATLIVNPVSGTPTTFMLQTIVIQHTNLGTGYVNHIGRDGETFFTGAYRFRVNEIEMFEITIWRKLTLLQFIPTSESELRFLLPFRGKFCFVSWIPIEICSDVRIESETKKFLHIVRFRHQKTSLGNCKKCRVFGFLRNILGILWHRDEIVNRV